MEALALLVVLVILFLLLRYYRTGKVKFRMWMRQYVDQRTLMIILKEDIQSELEKRNFAEGFEKALVLLGIHDKLISMLQDNKFLAYLQDPRNEEGQKLLQGLSTSDLNDLIENSSVALRRTYSVSLYMLFQLNMQLNLPSQLERWVRPNAQNQKNFHLYGQFLTYR